MASTHCRRPYPALDTDFIFSPSNTSFSLFSSSLIRLICAPFMSSFLYSCNALMKPTSDIMALAPVHPWLSSSLPRGRRITTHMQTMVTGGGGLAMPLTSVMSFLSNSSSARAADSKAGSAACSASSASAFSFSMITESFSICSAAALASSFLFVTASVFSLMSSIKTRTLMAFSSTMAFFSSSSLDISVTCTAACTSLSKPPPKRPDIWSKLLRLFSKNFM
mmetsp:Transcript_38323/g.78356  ORF Transcript_38323/g.78356 Transcript_38323/m.78356 type:complete len:222 (-) Transcript_38323:527-1192(-)